MSGGQIYHGADDNASGTAVVRGLARAFAAAGGAPRTLVFVLFGAEELGLLGSAHYVRHPAIPLGQTVAMVNLDMVGRLRGSVTVGGVDTGSGMRAIVNEASAVTGVPVTLRGESQPASDHSSFYRAGKSVLFFHTQGHDDYHKPTDTADKIDMDGLARVTALAAAVVERLAAAPAPTYAKAESPARRSRPPQASTPAGSAFLGIAGDGARRGDGVRLRDVIPGTAAAKAGVRAGDVLVRFGGEIVDGFEDVQRLVAARKPGDTVELVYVRNGEERTASAALGVRPEN
jgi:membrane-associated protease RseP (regulator of RpoE activity)